MSFPENSSRLVSLHVGGRQRNTNLRTFSIRMPDERPIPPSSTPPPVSQTFSHMPLPTFQPSQPSALRGNISVSAPTIFYNFAEGTEPAFVIDVMIPNNARPFSTQPPPGLANPRFLLYTSCTSPVATAPIKFIINGQTIRHWAVDHRPMDVTKLLLGFGQQNWLIIECGSVIVPFTVVGVWAGQVTLRDLLAELDMREKFRLEEVVLICPISGQSINVPVKGCTCAHRECFDLIAYLNMCQALGQWQCPICRAPLPLDNLRLGVQSDQFQAFDDPIEQPAVTGGGMDQFAENENEWWVI